jgi:GNAT superfamily N-acetyltransferase
VSDAFVRELEPRAFRAWPAAEVEERHGWLLRWTSGITRRGNSVFPMASGPSELGTKLEDVRAFYSQRGGPARFQLAPNAEPDGLDAELEARGWTVEAPVAIQVAQADQVAARRPRTPRLTCSVGASPEGAWLELMRGHSRFAQAGDVLTGFLERIGGRAGFAVARLDEEPVAVALGVRDGGWVGVFSMLTLPERRGHGVGGALLAGLARWARTRHCSDLYLQVERDNPAALRLYDRSGFREVYGYHYRREPA